MNYDDQNISNKSQLITLFLLMFFGSVGAHRFYVKKYFTGITYFIIGGTSFVLDFFGFGFALVAHAVFAVLICIDLYAIYSDSFTDSKGDLVVGKSKILVYETFEEREQILFTEKLNKLLLIFGGAAVYILYLVFTNIS